MERRGRRGRRTKETVHLVETRVETLFRLAEEEVANGRTDLADRYVRLAHRLGMRYNVRIPRDLRSRICPRCQAYLVTSENASWRVKRGRIIVHCRSCGSVMRRPFK
ncbi:MAG: ribonuclease P [Thermoplasmata archaeon]|nr:ribonuclease P [Thermoplasmata archaeon]